MDPHIHLSPHFMIAMPPEEKKLPYISKKHSDDLLSLNNKVEVNGKMIKCPQLSSLFVLNGIDCYKKKEKLRISKLFSDEDSVKRAALSKYEEINEYVVLKNSCDRHIIACNNFGNFLHGIASAMASGEQRFFILHSCIHVMSFDVVRKIKEIEGKLIDKWVVHFYDPNRTNVVARSEVLRPEDFLDSDKFSLIMFMAPCSYKEYFEVNPGLIERECAIYEYSDTREASFNFSTLEALSQDGISGCMIFHLMSNDIASLNIREIVRSKSFSTLSSSVRREIFFAKSSEGVPALYFAMSLNQPNSVKSYNEFLEELSSDEQMELLPDLLSSKDDDGNPALFLAMQEGLDSCIGAYSTLMEKQLMKIKERMPNNDFADMIFGIALAKKSDGMSALYIGMNMDRASAIRAYSILLDKVLVLLRGTVSDDKLSELINNLISYCTPSHDESPLLIALRRGYSDSVFAFGLLIDRLMSMKDCISNDKLSSMIFNLLKARTSKDIDGLFMAFQKGYTDTVNAFGSLLDKLIAMKGHIESDALVDMTFDLLTCKRDRDNVSGLFMAMYKGHHKTVDTFGELLDKALLALKGTVPDDKFARLIFKLLKARISKGVDGLFVALQEGNSNVVLSFVSLLDRLLSLKGCIEDTTLVGMLFDLLMCKSCDDSIPGLFVAMKNGHHVAVDAFGKLLEKLMMFKDDISTGYFNNMLLDLVASRRSDGVSGLFVALENDFPEVVKSYISLLKLIPKDELVNVLVASDSSGRPAALLAGSNALEAYFAMVSEFTTKTIYALHSQLSSARRSIEHILAGDSNLDGKYKLLLEKVKELAKSSRQSHYSLQ
ncbi:ShET2/EspL2 family type III secretion system effector toxin [Candidatus Ichthyocystis sparus]|uniref:ShET2/EspL2 family type III secretion system effector toxin n=2 Tax=Candidatus Ichthyocystis sparus TaxID=1561004 RepID=UPI00159EC218|nr:ShET2/EspL2 family type III secretion system effector toxin [Candidatus Ichthyocystis sparus]